MQSKHILLLVAGVFGTIAAVGSSQLMSAGSGDGGVETVEILVAVKDIQPKQAITSEFLRLEEWPKKSVPDGATKKLDDITSKYAKMIIFAGEPITGKKLIDEMTGAIVPKGYKAVSMRADSQTGVADLLQPGDVVDIIGFFEKNDVIPETAVKTVLKGVRVFALDNRYTREENSEGPKKPPKTISLLIPEKEVSTWTFANEMGNLRLVLGSTPDPDSPNDPKETFLDWMADHERKKQQAALTRQPTAPQTVAPEPTAPAQPDTYQVTKLVGGKVTVFEFTEGNPTPRIVAVYGSNDEDEQVDDPAASVLSGSSGNGLGLDD